MQALRQHDDMEWAQRGSCRGKDPDSWFARSLRTAGPAIRICDACSVRSSCLEYALANEIDFGVWGGLTERQRRAHRRRRLARQAS